MVIEYYFPQFFRARERSIYYDCAIFINKPHLWLFPYEHFSLSCLEQNPALDLGRELDSHSVHQLYYSSPPTERQYKQKGSLVSVILLRHTEPFFIFSQSNIKYCCLKQQLVSSKENMVCKIIPSVKFCILTVYIITLCMD